MKSFEDVRADERLRQVRCPPLNDHVSYVLSRGDTLVTCAGFEDRAFDFLREAVKAGSRGFDLIGIKYLPVEPANRTAELAALARECGSTLQWYVYDRENECRTSWVVEKSQRASRVIIDVSGMSRLLIVQLTAAFIRAGVASKVTIVYSEAEQYPPTRDEVTPSLEGEGASALFEVLNFVSSGVFGIIIPSELSTVAMYGQPLRLIAFPTFNATQFAALCAEINASAYTIIHGRRFREENEWKEAAIAALNRIDSLGDVEEASTSTMDYRETVALLLAQYERYGDRQKLVISPTGSKMQSLAVGIACGYLSDLQIVYPAPRSFPSPERYTTGVRHVYSLNLAFLPAFSSDSRHQVQAA